MYGFKQKTILWSITKSKWIHGPRLPYMTGIEESCATLVNRSVVLIIGMTRLNGMYQTKYNDVLFERLILLIFRKTLPSKYYSQYIHFLICKKFVRHF